MINHNSISDIRTLLEEEGIALKKRFGQNFLVDPHARERIAGTVLAAIPEEDRQSGEVWEIGPGIGSLTELLRAGGCRLRLFEVDRGLIRILKKEYGQDLAVEEGDFLHTLAALDPASVPAPVAVVGNLPYSSASAMVARIIESPWSVPVMVFLVQAELADRFAAAPGRKDYSALSVLVQSHYAVRTVFHIGGGSFYPPPTVGSTVVVLRRTGQNPDREEMQRTSEIARQAFSQRRKTLRNTLREYVPLLEELGIDPGERPERLSPGDFHRIAAATLRSDGS
jgi:16S rRNA (adenine1518-N6/adenine1519-N6)-dimethyltransferase